MFFLQPSLLIGLLGLSIPVAIHLIARRKRHKIVFGSLRFLRESQRRGYVVGAAQADRVADAIRAAELPLVVLPRDRFRAAGGD